MKPRSLLGVAPLIAALAFVVTPAVASAATVTIKEASTGTALPTGAPIEASSTNLLFTIAPKEAIECTENMLSGTVTNNGSGSATVSVTKPTSTGTGEALCDTSTGLGDTEFTWNASPTAPWTWTLKSSYSSELTNASKAIGFKTYYEGAEVTCEYTKTDLGDTFVEGAPLVDWLSGQVFTKTSKSSLSCAKEVTLSGYLTVTSEGHEVEAEV